MDNRYNITDAELEIMQLLWDRGQCSLLDIIKDLEKIKPRNKNTIKTLLYRLIDKNAVKRKKTNVKEVNYLASIEKGDYLSIERKTFLQKLYNGSAEKLLINFVEEKAISKDELKRLIKLLESEE